MPIFEYVCGECNHRFELLVYGSTTQAACPKCRATKLDKQFSAFGVGSTDAWVLPGQGGGACGSCGDPRGPGSCSLN